MSTPPRLQPTTPVAGITKSGDDYLQKKNVKKPNGSAPGFVVYYTNYSLVATPSLAHVTLVSDK